MNEWEKLNEKSWPERKEFYGELNIENITDRDYMDAKKVLNTFK